MFWRQREGSAKTESSLRFFIPIERAIHSPNKIFALYDFAFFCYL